MPFLSIFFLNFSWSALPDHAYANSTNSGKTLATTSTFAFGLDFSKMSKFLFYISTSNQYIEIVEF
jgi:hypothetical protein